MCYESILVSGKTFVKRSLVLAELRCLWKCFVALVAGKRPFSCVCSDMIVKSCCSGESTWAKSALEWFFPRMNDSMRAQLVWMRKLLRTMATLVRPVWIPCTDVHLKQAALSERLVALTTMPDLWLAIFQDEFPISNTRPFTRQLRLVLKVLETCFLQFSKHLLGSVSLRHVLYFRPLVDAITFLMFPLDVFLLSLFVYMDLSFCRPWSLRSSCRRRVKWCIPIRRCL